MKGFTTSIILVFLLLLTVIYHNDINTYILKKFFYKNEIVTQDISEYKLNQNVMYIKNTEQFVIYNKQNILNILYTILNNGWNDFSFYCDSNYTSCLEDVETIIYDKNTLSILNNFIHPYNSYDKINVTYNNLGRIQISVDKLYTDSDIEVLNAKADQILNSVIKPNMSTRDKLLALHDYIINNTKYDNEHALAIINNREPDNKYNSHKAVGPLINGWGVCGGYSDAMAIFLNKLNIPNYKVSNENHIWNLVYVDNKWYHLDLTWDDPVLNTNQDTLIHNYFMITSKELEDLKDDKHFYDKNIFIETNNN